MNAEEYVSQRLDDQIDWYDRKSASNQKLHKGLRMVEAVAAALVPFLVVFLPQWSETGSQLVIGALGVTIAVVAATLGLYRFQEQWIEYRSACESLKREKYFFLTGCEPYQGDETANLRLLVQRAEALMSKENASWTQLMKQPQESAERPE